MIDTYLKSTNREALEALRAGAVNVIGPVQGCAAMEAVTLEDGSVIPAQEAKGDPAYWYVCVRLVVPVGVSEEIEACDAAEGQAVCGLWL
ncbi:MAG: hypothetical protein PHW63_01005 [Alphaproteobacteria bacterium]|nr:hypothetical protein [Alphaproteobacteria bacterium]